MSRPGKSYRPSLRRRVSFSMTPHGTGETTLKFKWQMMVCLLAFAWAGIPGFVSSSLAGQNVSVTLLDGSSRTGELKSLNADQIEVTTANGAETIAAGTLMQLDFPANTAEATPSTALSLNFADQSTLFTNSLESDGTNATLSISEGVTASVPVKQIADIRLAPVDDKIAARWEELRSRNARDDLLVIRKGDVLDYVAGSIGRITPTAVTMLVREKELSAPREKAFGLIFASRTPPKQMRRVAVRTRQGDAIQAETLQLEENSLQLTSASLGKLSFPLDKITSLDFGGGRIRLLADLPFDESASKDLNASNPVVWFVSRNAPSGSGGKAPLTIGTREFRKGLWMHSGAVVRFRLNRDYVRLTATAGFDLTHVTRMPRFNPRVRLVILGDGKELYSKEFLWNDPPEALDIDLKDVRELTVRVDTAGSGQGILEHFALGDAQVIQ